MAVEALQVNRSKPEENDNPAKGKAVEKTAEQVRSEELKKPAEQETAKNDRYQQLLAKHKVPAEEEYSHKREQLYLMVGQELSDAFIAKVIGFPSQAIDRLRMAVFVTGEEFLHDHILKEPPEEDQIRSWIDDFMKPSEAPAGAVQGGTSVEKSLDIMGRHMVRQQEIAGEQINRLTEYLRRMNEMMQERSEKDIHAIREENQIERERAQKQIDLLSDENFRLSMKIEDVQEEAKKKEAEEKERATVGNTVDPAHTPKHPAHDEGLFARRRRMKEFRQREAFISAALGNSDFSAEQLTVVRRVVEKDFTLSQLQKICDPQVKPENMELLEAYYLRRQTHG